MAGSLVTPAPPSGAAIFCAHGRTPHQATHVVTSGAPGSGDGYHAAASCERHLDVAKRAASRTTSGLPVRVEVVEQEAGDTRPTTCAPCEPYLFELGEAQ